jgi:hypothetical protein
MARYRKARRFGARDEGEFDLETELTDLRNDETADVRDYLAAIVASCDQGQLIELSAALREIVESFERGGNLSRWGEDRRFVRDQRRKHGRDDPPEFSGMPRTGGEMDPINEDRRRVSLAGDRMAYDRLPSGLRLPRVERC